MAYYGLLDRTHRPARIPRPPANPKRLVHSNVEHGVYSNLWQHGRRASIAIDALSCTAAIAGCGSSGTPRTSAAAGNQFVTFSQCMRAHRVSNFPDPSSGGGVQFSPSADQPVLAGVQGRPGASRKLLPGGGPAAHGPPSAQAKAQMLGISGCMRAHGCDRLPYPNDNAAGEPDRL